MRRADQVGRHRQPQRPSAPSTQGRSCQEVSVRAQEDRWAEDKTRSGRPPSITPAPLQRRQRKACHAKGLKREHWHRGFDRLPSSAIIATGTGGTRPPVPITGVINRPFPGPLAWQSAGGPVRRTWRRCRTRTISARDWRRPGSSGPDEWGNRVVVLGDLLGVPPVFCGPPEHISTPSRKQ